MTISSSPDSGASRPDSLDEARARRSRHRPTGVDDLEKALHANEFTLVYQPIVSPDAQKLVGVEALVRWTSRTGEVVLPNEFIPLAERTGFIRPLGLWVLRNACAQALRWQGIRLAVNMSPIQLQDPDFVSDVRDILLATGYPGQMLELELTETAALADVVNARRDMVALRREGVRLALDDFGTGYSGLIYLRRLPVDKIKIDREFLTALTESGDASILVRSMVQLGRDLGITVTAEGVENVEAQALLADAGCHELQGFLFARPLPAAVIDEMIARQQRGEPVLPPGAEG